MCLLDELNKREDFEVEIKDHDQVGSKRGMYAVQVKYKDNTIFTMGKFLCPAESKSKVKKMYIELLKNELNNLKIKI